MGWFNLIAPFFQPIWESMSKIFMGIFLIRQGKKDQQLEDLKQEKKATDAAAKTKASVKSMSDDDLAAILRVPKTTKRKRT